MPQTMPPWNCCFWLKQTLQIVHCWLSLCLVAEEDLEGIGVCGSVLVFILISCSPVMHELHQCVS